MRKRAGRTFPVAQEGDGRMSIFRVQLSGSLTADDRMLHQRHMRRFFASCNENGVAVFSRILEWVEERAMWIHWGPTDFTVNVDLGGDHVAFCFGRPRRDPVCGQSIYLPLRDSRAIGDTAIPEQNIQTLEAQALSTGLFTPTDTGISLRHRIRRRLTDGEVESLLAWCEAAAAAIREHGLRQ